MLSNLPGIILHPITIAAKNKYQPLNLPPAELRLRESDNCVHVWDRLRNKWLVLSPEEWVRQHFISFLINYHGIDAHRVAQEYTLDYNGLPMRADIVVFSRAKEPSLIVECKATSVAIGQDIVDQVGRYNAILGLEYIAITNGLQHFCWQIDHNSGSVRSISKLPEGL